MVRRRNFREVDWDSRHHASDCHTGNGTSREEHSNVNRSCLDGGANGNDNASELHETNATELIPNRSLRESTDCLAGDVDGDHGSG